MKKLIFVSCSILFIVWILCSIAFPGSSVSSDWEIDLGKLTNEIQRMKSSPGLVRFASWLPEEYWVADFKRISKASQSSVSILKENLKPYLIFVAVEGNIMVGGTIKYSSKDELGQRIWIKDKHGDYYKPLKEEQVSDAVKDILDKLKPGMGKEIGPAGENMHFFVFLNKNQRGEKIAVAKERGMFRLRIGTTTEFKWRTPLDSVLPPVICNKCSDICSPSWNYCAWCGEKL